MKHTVTLSIGMLVLTACAPLDESGLRVGIDCVPPVLEGVETAGRTTLSLRFSEPVSLDDESFACAPELLLAVAEPDGARLLLTLASPMELGRPYQCRLTVRDASGNSTWLVVCFYGHNPRVPAVLINEFTSQGSATHPDLVELKVYSAGNMGGLTFYHGTAGRYRYRFVFPAFEVAPGDFILLHVKPGGLPEEIDETLRKDASGGLDATPSAFDLWVRDGDGLSGNNGVISLYAAPGGDAIDAVLYSTRTSESDDRYRGFGSYDLLKQAEELAADGGWAAEHEEIRPEDGVNPEESTATRSLCRSAGAPDTNTKADFHIVPTRQASFGDENSDEIYSP